MANLAINLKFVSSDSSLKFVGFQKSKIEQLGRKDKYIALLNLSDSENNHSGFMHTSFSELPISVMYL